MRHNNSVFEMGAKTQKWCTRPLTILTYLKVWKSMHQVPRFQNPCTRQAKYAHRMHTLSVVRRQPLRDQFYPWPKILSIHLYLFICIQYICFLFVFSYSPFLLVGEVDIVLLGSMPCLPTLPTLCYNTPGRQVEDLVGSNKGGRARVQITC